MVNNYIRRAAFVVIGFPAGLLFLEAGCYPPIRHAREGGDVSRAGAPRGAIFGLPGLLLAFPFSGAAKPFETRIGWAVEWINAIRTAFLRIDMLPAETQAPSDLCSAIISRLNQRPARRSQA